MMRFCNSLYQHQKKVVSAALRRDPAFSVVDTPRWGARSCRTGAPPRRRPEGAPHPPGPLWKKLGKTLCTGCRSAVDRLGNRIRNSRNLQRKGRVLVL